MRPIRIATWNLNNRVGRVRFRPEAAAAAAMLPVDVLVFNEYFPQERHEVFSTVLSKEGFEHQHLSPQQSERANRVLIASRVPLSPLPIFLPSWDSQFPANVAAVFLSGIGLSVVGLRVPAYKAQQSTLLALAWDWIEGIGQHLLRQPALILGDMNAGPHSANGRGGQQFRRLLQSGWVHANASCGPTFFGSGGRVSEIDHILASPKFQIESCRVISQLDEKVYFAGSSNALSDHAVLYASGTVNSNTDAAVLGRSSAVSPLG